VIVQCDDTQNYIKVYIFSTDKISHSSKLKPPTMLPSLFRAPSTTYPDNPKRCPLSCKSRYSIRHRIHSTKNVFFFFLPSSNSSDGAVLGNSYMLIEILVLEIDVTLDLLVELWLH